MSEPVAFLNGEFVPYSQAVLPVTDLGIVAGASVTEMLRTFRHQPYRVSDHLDRLFRSIELMGFPVTPSRPQIEDAIQQVATRNAHLIPDHHDLGIVAFVTAGQNLTYLGGQARDQVANGTVCVHSFPLPFELWVEKQTQGQRLASVDVLPLPVESVSPMAKHRNRIHWLRADREARDRIPGSTALLATPDGSITETSSGNFYVVKDGTIHTPPSELVLGGISRLALGELAEAEGFIWSETGITVDDIRSADEALTTSTPSCLLPVTHFNDAPIGSGKPGPVFRQLMAAWSNQVGLDIVQQAVDVARERGS